MTNNITIIGTNIPQSTGTPATWLGEYARPLSLLCLEEYARAMGLNPLRMAGAYNSLVPPGDCNDIWFEWDYQAADKASRQQVLREIYHAEEDIVGILGYWPAPMWVEDEPHRLANSFRPEDRNAGSFRFGPSVWPQMTAWPGRPTVHAALGYVRGVGKRRADLVDQSTVSDLVPNGQGVVAGREDQDGDGFAEWAHIVIDPIPVGAVASEIHVYFQDADRAAPGPGGADPAWEIRPVRAQLAAGKIHLYIPAWQLFKPALRYGMAAQAIDADDQANYVTAVSVYREYADSTTQVTLEWPRVLPTDTLYSEPGTADIVNARNGGLQVFLPSSYCEYGSAERALISYRSGRYDTLSPFWAEMIAILATTRLTRALCACGGITDRVQHWQEDLSYSGEAGSHQTTQTDLYNRLGTRRGEITVWKRIQTLRLARAIRV